MFQSPKWLCSLWCSHRQAPSSSCHDEPQRSSLWCWALGGSGCSCHGAISCEPCRRLFPLWLTAFASGGETWLEIYILLGIRDMLNGVQYLHPWGTLRRYLISLSRTPATWRALDNFYASHLKIPPNNSLVLGKLPVAVRVANVRAMVHPHSIWSAPSAGKYPSSCK